MPRAWAEALAYPSGKAPAFGGTFENVGAGGKTRLDALLWGETLTPTPQKIRLRLIGKNQLEASALSDESPPVTKTLVVEVDEKTGGIALPNKSNLIDPKKGGAGWETHTLELFMGNDGRLYGHVGTGGAVLYAFVIPVAGERLLWFRWAVAQPERPTNGG